MSLPPLPPFPLKNGRNRPCLAPLSLVPAAFFVGDDDDDDDKRTTPLLTPPLVRYNSGILFRFPDE